MDIKVKNKKGEYFTVLIDDEDYIKIKDFKWHAWNKKDDKYYVVASSTQKAQYHKHTVRMHNIIMNCPEGMIVDHKNRNTFDNRKENLRICTTGDNLKNRTKDLKKKYSSCYKGVCFEKRRNHYIANIAVNKKNIYLGSFENEDQAAIAYNIAALKYHAEFACLNDNIMMHKGFH
jgi:hypothetical protein